MVALPGQWFLQFGLELVEPRPAEASLSGQELVSTEREQPSSPAVEERQYQQPEREPSSFDRLHLTLASSFVD